MDLVWGALVGAVLGLAAYVLYRHWLRRLTRRTPTDHRPHLD